MLQLQMYNYFLRNSSSATDLLFFAFSLKMQMPGPFIYIFRRFVYKALENLKWSFPTTRTRDSITSGDLKSGDSLFFATPRNSMNPDPSPPLTNMGMTKDIIWSFTSSIYYQTSRLSFWCQKYRCKNAPETVLWIRKIQVLSLKWAKSQTKAQKSSNDDPYLGDMVTRTGDWQIGVVCGTLPDNLEELARMQN